MTDTLLLAAIVGYFCVGPVLLAASYVISDAWRAWRWRRNAPARAARAAERERESRARIDAWNAEAIAGGSGERFILAGMDCLVVSYRSRSDR